MAAQAAHLFPLYKEFFSSTMHMRHIFEAKKEDTRTVFLLAFELLLYAHFIYSKEKNHEKLLLFSQNKYFFFDRKMICLIRFYGNAAERHLRDQLP